MMSLLVSESALKMATLSMAKPTIELSANETNSLYPVVEGRLLEANLVLSHSKAVVVAASVTKASAVLNL